MVDGWEEGVRRGGEWDTSDCRIRWDELQRRCGVCGVLIRRCVWGPDQKGAGKTTGGSDRNRAGKRKERKGRGGERSGGVE